MAKFSLKSQVLTPASILTTGQVAKIVGVAPRTATKWCDSKRLKCYRVPGCKDRRIVVRDLLLFMRKHNVPIPTALIPAKHYYYGLNCEDLKPIGTEIKTEIALGAELATNNAISLTVGGIHGSYSGLWVCKVIHELHPKLPLFFLPEDDFADVVPDYVTRIKHPIDLEIYKTMEWQDSL